LQAQDFSQGVLDLDVVLEQIVADGDALLGLDDGAIADNSSSWGER